MDRVAAGKIADEIQRAWNVKWSAGGQTDWLDAITTMDEQHARQALLRFRPVDGQRPGLDGFRRLVQQQAERADEARTPRRPAKLDEQTIDLGRRKIAEMRDHLAAKGIS